MPRPDLIAWRQQQVLCVMAGAALDPFSTMHGSKSQGAKSYQIIQAKQ
jgi:hypothetical protein